MINLLSPFEKKKITKEYRIRLSVVTLLGVFLLEIITWFSLVPSYVSITTSSSELAQSLALQKSTATSGGDDADRQISVIKNEITLLKSGSTPTDVPPSPVMEDVLRVKPRGIDVTAFAFNRTKEAVMVQLNGIADTREDLLAFQRSLKSNTHFDDVHYADSFITKKTDINFQLTLKLK